MVGHLVKFIGVVIVAAASLLALVPAARAEDLSGAAHSTCQMFALDQLQSRDVHFAGLGERGTGARVPAGLNAAHYQVLSFVDVRGASGAVARSSLYCELRLIGEDRWLLERLVITPNEVPTAITRPLSAAAPRADLP
jgi:hypothetical protein